MIHCKLLSISHLIASIFLIDHALAYMAEEIVGGFDIYPESYRYIAAIVGKYNTTPSTHLLGGGTIISPNLILSTARCFLGGKNKLKKQTFFAVVGQFGLAAKNLILRDIASIYTYLTNSMANLYDIAVARLKERLDLDGLNLMALQIPEHDETFYDLTGDVAGFGLNTTNDPIFYENRERIRLHDRREQLLTYAFVTIQSVSKCLEDYTNTQISNSFCGVMTPDQQNPARGICLLDTGSPLQFDNKVIGIASKHNPTCDDTNYGAIYTKVSYFTSFLKGIISGNFIEGTKVCQNYPHVPQFWE